MLIASACIALVAGGRAARVVVDHLHLASVRHQVLVRIGEQRLERTASACSRRRRACSPAGSPASRDRPDRPSARPSRPSATHRATWCRRCRPIHSAARRVVAGDPRLAAVRAAQSLAEDHAGLRRNAPPIPCGSAAVAPAFPAPVLAAGELPPAIEPVTTPTRPVSSRPDWKRCRRRFPERPESSCARCSRAGHRRRSREQPRRPSATPYRCKKSRPVTLVCVPLTEVIRLRILSRTRCCWGRERFERRI